LRLFAPRIIQVLSNQSPIQAVNRTPEILNRNLELLDPLL
jgi:hypothetical protein